MKKKGFTLVELLIVIAVIAILATIVTPTAFKALDKSKVSTVEADYKAIKTATLNFHADTGKWPTDSLDFTTKPSGVSGWNGPYIDHWPSQTPWGGTYSLALNADGTGVAVATSPFYLGVTGTLPSDAITQLTTDLTSSVWVSPTFKISN